MKFEWDAGKAVLNVRKHGVSFEFGTLVFLDLNRVETIDDSIAYGEERVLSTGLAKDKMLTVVYTQRGEYIRIISVRKATRHEQQDYYLQIGT